MVSRYAPNKPGYWSIVHNSCLVMRYCNQINARGPGLILTRTIMARVRAAAGAGYSGSTCSSSKPSFCSQTGGCKASAVKPSVAKPSQTNRPGPEPNFDQSQFVPKPAVAKPAAKQDAGDGWGDAKEIEERDFDPTA